MYKEIVWIYKLITNVFIYKIEHGYKKCFFYLLFLHFTVVKIIIAVI